MMRELTLENAKGSVADFARRGKDLPSTFSKEAHDKYFALTGRRSAGYDAAKSRNTGALKSQIRNSYHGFNQSPIRSAMSTSMARSASTAPTRSSLGGLDISKGTHPDSANYFGHMDYYANKAAGMSAADQLAILGKNMNVLSPGAENQPGGGGLYDQMVADAEMEKFTQATNTANQALLDSFAQQMETLNNQMLEQQASYESTLAEMTNTLKSNRTPNTRASSMGVRQAQSNNPALQTIRGQGMAGQFGREGLRIKNMNV